MSKSFKSKFGITIHMGAGTFTVKGPGVDIDVNKLRTNRLPGEQHSEISQFHHHMRRFA
jgi:hypothetical protein